MIYLVAIVCPPLALLFKGKIFQAILNGLLWGISAILFVASLGFLGALTFPIWVVTIIWAILSIRGANEEERHQEIVDAIKSKN
jgi:ABC-type siderophore export system fused ATPase/permease subunit